MSGGQSTKQNWLALYRLAELFLRQQYNAQEAWCFADLLDAVGLPDTPLIREMAQKAGFDLVDGLSRREQSLILQQLQSGNRQAPSIAFATGISVEKVKAHLIRIGLSFGDGMYGNSPWAATNTLPEEELAKYTPRKISARGQISFAGKLYCVGVQHCNNVCWVRSQESGIEVRFANHVCIQIQR